MSPKDPPVLDPKPAGALAPAQPTPGRAKPALPRSSWQVTVARLLATGLVLAGYIVFYGQLIDLFTNVLRWVVTTIDPANELDPAAPRVVAVTLLGFVLAGAWWPVIKADPRFHGPILITYILAMGYATYGILENFPSPFLAQMTFGLFDSYSPTFVAILTAVVTEMVLGRLVTGKWPHLASAYITGISVGILIRSPHVWPYILCSAISIVSKYALRVHGRHIWNPSNFGISLILILGLPVGILSVHWGNEPWPVYVIWCLGSVILLQVRRLHITLTYALAFCLLAWVRSAITGDRWGTEVAQITSPMYQLFMFFMITDPKTTTRTIWSQCLVTVIIAAVEMLFRLCAAAKVQDFALQLFGPDLDTNFLTTNLATYAPFYALCLVGPIANLIEIWHDSRKAQAEPTMMKV